MSIFQDTLHRARRNSGKVKIGAAVIATAGVIVASPWTPPPTTTGGVTAANVWVSNSGSYTGCARSSTPVAYNAATDCPLTDSATDAYGVAASNDIIGVKGGAYSAIRMPSNRSGITGITVSPAQGETPSFAGFIHGCIGNTRCAVANDGPDSMTYTGPMKSRSFIADRSDYVTVNGWDIDVAASSGNTVNQPVHTENSTNITIKNSEIHNSFNANSLMFLSGTNITLDHNDIHNELNNTNGQLHDECIYWTAGGTVTITRNHFWSCAVQDIMFTFTANVSGVIANNVFEHTLGSAGNLAAGLVFHDTSGGATPARPDGLLLENNTFGAQSGVTINNTDNAPTSNGFIVRNNFFALGVPCGLSNTTYTNNASPGTASCDTNHVNVTGGAPYGFVNWQTWQGSGGATAEPAGDYHLLSTSLLRDRGHPTLFQPLDITGASRPFNGTPDIGAYEYGG